MVLLHSSPSHTATDKQSLFIRCISDADLVRVVPTLVHINNHLMICKRLSRMEVAIGDLLELLLYFFYLRHMQTLYIPTAGSSELTEL